MERRKTSFRNYTVLIAALAVTALILSTVSGTIAWLQAQSDTLTSTFEAGTVPIRVNGNTDIGENSEVRIENQGNIPVYIRAAVIPIWREVINVGEPTEELAGTGLATDGTYNIEWNLHSESNDSMWVKYGEYYYYTKPVPAETSTEDYLFADCSPISLLPDEYEGKIFEIQVIASSIQSEPEEAVNNAWGVSISPGSVTQYHKDQQ